MQHHEEQRPHERGKPAEQYRLASPHHTQTERQPVRGRGKVKPQAGHHLPAKARHHCDASQGRRGETIQWFWQLNVTHTGGPFTCCVFLKAHLKHLLFTDFNNITLSNTPKR